MENNEPPLTKFIGRIRDFLCRYYMVGYFLLREYRLGLGTRYHRVPVGIFNHLSGGR